MKLNLGCRNNLMHGYINIDIDCEDLDVVKMDIMCIDTHYEAESIEEIHAAHFFEHLTHQQITILLYKLWALLIPGGKLIVTTPDFYNVINSYVEKHRNGDFSDADILHIKVFDTEEETYHKTVWYKEIGVWYLTREGFFDIKSIERPSNIEIKFIAEKK